MKLRLSPDPAPVWVPLRPPAPVPLRGLGDAVALAAEPVKRAIQRWFPGALVDCGCPARQAWLNRLIPFRKT